MIRALGHVKHVQFIPDEVAKRLDYWKAMKQFDRDRLKELRILPLAKEETGWIVGICNGTKDAHPYRSCMNIRASCAAAAQTGKTEQEER